MRGAADGHLPSPVTAAINKAAPPPAQAGGQRSASHLSGAAGFALHPTLRVLIDGLKTPGSRPFSRRR